MASCKHAMIVLTPYLMMVPVCFCLNTIAVGCRPMQEVSPYAAATSLARRLQLYPSQEVLSAGGVLDLEVLYNVCLIAAGISVSCFLSSTLLFTRKRHSSDEPHMAASIMFCARCRVLMMHHSSTTV